MAGIVDDLYDGLQETSFRVHAIGLVGLSEAILHGRDPGAFLAVLDAHEAGR